MSPLQVPEPLSLEQRTDSDDSHVPTGSTAGGCSRRRFVSTFALALAALLPLRAPLCNLLSMLAQLKMRPRDQYLTHSFESLGQELMAASSRIFYART